MLPHNTHTTTLTMFDLPQLMLVLMPATAAATAAAANVPYWVTHADDDENTLANIHEELAAYTGPSLARHERPRSRPQSQPARQRRRLSSSPSAAAANCPPTISPQQRVSQFPRHPFCVRGALLFCLACATAVNTKLSTVRNHIGSQRHVDNVVVYEERVSAGKAQQQFISDYYFANPTAPGRSLPPTVQQQRLQVVKTFLGSGIPLLRAVFFRDFFRQLGLSLTSQSHFADIVPQVLAEENSILLQEISGQWLSIIYDGTSRLGDCFNAIVRYCTENFTLVVRLTLVQTLAVAADAEALSALLGRHVLTDLRVDAKMLVAWIRDSCAVNGAASRRLQTFFPDTLDRMCLSHLFACMGDKVVLPVLDAFLTAWFALCGNSHVAVMIWSNLIGKHCKRFSIRWHAKAEVAAEFATNFPLIADLIAQLQQRCAGTSTNTLRDIFHQQNAALQAQLATILDLEPLVRYTYFVEGDRLEILRGYDVIENIRTLGRTFSSTCTNLDAVCRNDTNIGTGTPFRKAFPGHGLCDGTVTGTAQVQSSLQPGQTVTAYTVFYPSDGSSEDLEDAELRQLLNVDANPERVAAIAGVMPAFEYLESRLTLQGQYYFANVWSMMKAVRMFDPVRAVQLNLDASCIDIVAAEVPTIGNNLDIAVMKTEFPTFLTAAATVDAETFDHNSMNTFTSSVLRFWRLRRKDFPELAKAARMCFSISASSAPSERVFSLMKRFFGKYSGRDRALADQVAASLKLSYNRRLGQ
eukprot:COSAG02_NODE_990_length_15413_cov_24.707457_5_plen_753_part_00